jgi:RimJ/RimL family protein N-acetyltransferase
MSVFVNLIDRGDRITMNKPGTQKIETERLILRRFVIEDADDMFNGWCNDPEVSKYLTWPPHGKVEVTKSLLNA